MTDVTARSSPAIFANEAVESRDSNPTIVQSKLIAPGGGALIQNMGGTGKVALTQLVGGFFVANGGSVQCFNNYNENMAAVTCP
jgi:hypothetical protein